jgi:hypothetical protein
MPLYDRLCGRNDSGEDVENRFPLHSFNATLGEFARGQITGAQAQVIVNTLTGAPLSPSEITEATTLLATVTSAGNAAARLARAKLIEDVLILAEIGAPGYTTPTQVRTRLGT